MAGSFSTFTAGTLANPSLVNDNFYYTKQGILASLRLQNYLHGTNSFGKNTPANLHDDFFGMNTGSSLTGLTHNNNQYTKTTPGNFTFISAPLVTNSNTGSVIGFVDYQYFSVMDEFNDSSFSNTLWGSRTVSGSFTITEDTEKLTMTSTKGNVTGSIVSLADYSGSSRAMWSYSADLLAGDAGVDIGIGMQLTDLTSSVNLYTESFDGDSSSQSVQVKLNGVFDVSIDWARKFAYYTHRYYRTESGQSDNHYAETMSHFKVDTGSVNLSGFSTLKYRFYMSNTSGTGQCNGTFNLNYMRFGKTNPSSVGSFFATTNGTTYDAMENGLGLVSSTTGSRLQIKFTGSVATGEGVAISRCVHGTF